MYRTATVEMYNLCVWMIAIMLQMYMFVERADPVVCSVYPLNIKKELLVPEGFHCLDRKHYRLASAVESEWDFQ